MAECGCLNGLRMECLQSDHAHAQCPLPQVFFGHHLVRCTAGASTAVVICRSLSTLCKSTSVLLVLLHLHPPVIFLYNKLLNAVLLWGAFCVCLRTCCRPRGIFQSSPQVIEDLKDECSKHGEVYEVKVPRPKDPRSAHQTFGTANYGKVSVGLKHVDSLSLV